MTTQDLTDLLAEGFALVLIRRGEKRPLNEEWQKIQFTIDQFTEADNVGVKCGAPSGHKVDVDLDAPEAVRAAELLPLTRVHGRPGKRNSHHWFICADLKRTITFEDPFTSKPFLELRGTGGQTVVPPSIHPSGERLIWENRQPFVPMSFAHLYRIVAEIAAVSLLARYWPEGSRHSAALHVGGFFARLELPVAVIERMMGLITTIAGDEEAGDRIRAAKESAEKHQRGEKTTGGPHLAELLPEGKAIVGALYKWFGREGDDQLEEFNAKHFVVAYGGVMNVGTETSRGVDFERFFTFRERYCNRFVGKQTLADLWLRSPKRREYDSVIFAPPFSRNKAGPRDYNLWRGFTVQPDTSPHPEERCARFINHVYQVLARGTTEYAEYVLDFIADLVQKPGRLIGKALCLRGKPGVGKSVFVEALGRFFHPQNFFIASSRDQLHGEKNGHLSGNVLLFGEEAVWGGNKADASILKRLITQDTTSIRRMYHDAVMEPNCCHLIMATNDKWPYNAENLERRLVVLDVAERQPDEYYIELFREVESLGFSSALMATLLARTVNETRLRAGLDTAALAEIKQLSARPVQQYWHQTLEDGEVGGHDSSWPEFLSTRALYVHFCEEMGYRRAGVTLGTRQMFTAELKSLLPGVTESTRRRVRVNTAKIGEQPFLAVQNECVYPLRSLRECRRFFDQVTGSTHAWPEDNEQPPLVIIK